MRGDARLTCGKDRMDAVDATKRRATCSWSSLVAGCRSVIEIRAARTLEKIASDRCFVSKLPGGAGEQRFRQRWEARAHTRIGGDLRIGRLRSDPDPAIRQIFDLVQGQPADIDQMRRLLD